MIITETLYEVQGQSSYLTQLTFKLYKNFVNPLEIFNKIWYN